MQYGLQQKNLGAVNEQLMTLIKLLYIVLKVVLTCAHILGQYQHAIALTINHLSTKASCCRCSEIYVRSHLVSPLKKQDAMAKQNSIVAKQYSIKNMKMSDTSLWPGALSPAPMKRKITIMVTEIV